MGKTDTTNLLDVVEKMINQGHFSEAFSTLYHEMDNIRRSTSKEDWKQFITQYRQHAVCRFFLQEPFSRRAFEKPRGYAGDPVMMDSIYDFDKSAPSPYEGRQAEISELLNYELNRISYANDAVRERKRIFSSKIDETAERVVNPYILSFPSGHLREVLDSVAVKNKRIGKFVAIDQDKEALSVAAEIIKDFGEAIPASIVDIITNEVSLPGFDFIYSVGVFDYLPNGVAKKLVNELFNLLNPGGRLLIANWLPDTPSIAYMEAALDWWITYRTKEQMQELIEDIPKGNISNVDIFIEKYEVVVFMEIEKAGETKLSQGEGGGKNETA
ncbi:MULTISPECIES: class I SAM-dependent methyltransferase [Paenibacillus]|uniref:class I SAM-dependent methyltransferase n=1 Tax=Paenibacillus TaxID=44249 RepID=UPI00119F7B2C|nr:class I SAM-dependent methyltransferase [Paenibacillus sp. Y412MC10]